MPDVRETDLDPFCDLNYGIVIEWFEMLDDILRVLNGIERLHLWQSGTLGLPVLPFCLHFLNVCAVTKHDLAQIRGCLGRINGASKAM